MVWLTCTYKCLIFPQTSFKNGSNGGNALFLLEGDVRKPPKPKSFGLKKKRR